MKNQKIKLLLTLTSLLLFLITWVGQVKAATYWENSNKVAKALNEYVCQPVVDLVTFTSNSLFWPYKNFYLPDKFIKVVLKDLNNLGTSLNSPVGKLLAKSGGLLAVIPNNLPKLTAVSRDTADFLVQVMPKFKNWSRIFEVSGQALAILPNNLPNLHQVSTDIGELLISSGTRVKQSVVITAAFFNETFNNLTNNPPKEFYPKTQQLITSAKNNLDNNYYQVNFYQK